MSGRRLKNNIITCKKNLFFNIIIGFTLFAVSCISPFEPDHSGFDDVLVVDGSFIKGQEKQVIRISRSSSVAQPEYKPVSNCQVKVTDNSGNEFLFHEESPGSYVANIDDALLKYDTQYKLVFFTADGNNYESEYQQIMPTPPVDSIYGIKEYHKSTDPTMDEVYGMQFYIDLDAPEDASRYYRWLFEETWEIHAYDEIWGYYDGQTIKTFSKPDSLFYCWKTVQRTGLYSESTANLSKNRMEKIPLFFKLETAYALMIKYCLTVKQYALDKNAYEYWHQKQVELNESGGIYTSQPGRPKSNIFNVNNPDELVLGFFWASSCAQKRYFLTNPFRKVLNYDIRCGNIGAFPRETDLNTTISDLLEVLTYWRNLGLSDPQFDLLPDPPIYIIRKLPGYDFVLNAQCADCRKYFESDTIKPVFWE